MPAAMPTPEALPTPIRFASFGMNMQALVTGSTGISRIHSDDLNSCLDCLVREKQAQLVERPTVAASTLCFIARQFMGAFSDARQILHGNRIIQGFSLLHDRLTDSMVQPLLIASLSARQPLQNLPCPAASRSCAFRGFSLERCPDSGKLISNLLDVLPVPSFPLGCNSNVSTPKINPNHIAGLGWLWCFVLQLDVQIEVAITMLAKLSRSRFTALELTSLVVSRIQLHFFSALNRRKADLPILLSEGKQVFVAVHARWRKLFNWLAFELGSFAVCRHTSTSPDRHVRHQRKLLLDGLIGQRLQGDFVSKFWVGVVVDIIASIRKRLKRRIQFNDLFRSGLKLYNYCQDLFHGSNYTTKRRLTVMAKILADFGGIEPLSISAPIPLTAKLRSGGSTPEV